MTEQIPPKKRGAPFGNTNAVKHGYYAATLHRSTIQQLQDRPQLPGLAIEKQFLAFLFERIEKQLGQPLQQCSPTDKHLHIFVLSLYFLTHLLHTHGILHDTFTQSAETALAEVLDELFHPQP